jgi:hypothetical protein
MQSEADIALGMDHIQRRLARLYKQAYKVRFFSFLLLKIQHVGKKVSYFEASMILVCFVSMLLIRSRISWIRMLLGLQDPDPKVRGTDPSPDPSLFS